MTAKWHKLGPAWVRDEDVLRVEFYDATDAGAINAPRAVVHVRPLQGREQTCFDVSVKDAGPLLDRIEGKGERLLVAEVGEDDDARLRELLARKVEMYQLAYEGWALATDLCHRKDARIAELEREVADLRDMLGHGHRDREGVTFGVG